VEQVKNPQGKRSDQNLLSSILIITASTLLVSYFHYAVPKHFSVVHISHYYAYYLIVIYAAYKFGFAGGIAVSAIISLIYAPKAYFLLFTMNVTHSIVPSIVEISMIFAVGGIAGYFSSKLRREKQKVEKVSAEMLELEKQIAHDDRLRVLGQLSAGIAHEIRNPLASIKSGISLMKSGKGNDQVTDILHSEIERLNSFVDRFLQYARIDIDKVQNFDLQDFCSEISELAKLAAAKTSIKIETEILTEKDTIYGDKNALKQAMLNIIINCVEELTDKPDGLIKMTINSDDEFIYFKIQDNGRGIGIEKPEKIFEPFFTTKDNGTGLGLAIAMKIIKAHNGDISVESDETGSAFTLKISGATE
jgi:signal transduction histidine kinase